MSNVVYHGMRRQNVLFMLYIAVLLLRETVESFYVKLCSKYQRKFYKKVNFELCIMKPYMCFMPQCLSKIREHTQEVSITFSALTTLSLFHFQCRRHFLALVNFVLLLGLYDGLQRQITTKEHNIKLFVRSFYPYILLTGA